MKGQPIKNVLSIVLLIMMINVNHTFSQEYIIKDIGSVPNNSRLISPGDILRVSINSDDISPLLNKLVFLYFNGVRSEIKAFEKNVEDKIIYFHLEENELAKILSKNPKIIKDSLSLSIGFETHRISNSANVFFELPKVVAKFNGGNSGGLNDPVAIEVVDKTRFFQLKNKSEPLLLYMDHILLDSSKMIGFDDDQSIATFSLDANEVLKKFYNQESRESFIIGVGTAENNILTVSEKFNIDFYTSGYRAFSWILILGLFILLFVLSINTDLIRDIGTYKVDDYRPFSFARTQLAFWSFIIISSFIFIWFTTKELAFFPNSALILLGISVSVTAVGRVIDSRISPIVKQKLKPFRGIGLGDFKNMVFFREILSDGGGLSIHRFQYFAFNLFLGIVFARSVYYNLEMPSFSTELLSMMGVSATAFAGIKGIESNNIGNSQSVAVTNIHAGEDTSSASVAG